MRHTLPQYPSLSPPPPRASRWQEQPLGVVLCCTSLKDQCQCSSCPLLAGPSGVSPCGVQQLLQQGTAQATPLMVWMDSHLQHLGKGDKRVAQHSTAQHSTAQHSTAQHSAEGVICGMGARLMPLIWQLRHTTCGKRLGHLPSSLHTQGPAHVVLLMLLTGPPSISWHTVCVWTTLCQQRATQPTCSSSAISQATA
jgi:hypothetical protein